MRQGQGVNVRGGHDVQMSRPEITKKIWVLIKERGLQDQANKRTIVCDNVCAVADYYNMTCTPYCIGNYSLALD